jgi:NADH dehydrogenase
MLISRLRLKAIERTVSVREMSSHKPPETKTTSLERNIHRVVIIGGGFGGLYAAKALRNAPVEVTLIDKRNFHLFQPLLYQVATGGLSPGDICSPLRGVLSKCKNINVLMAEVTDILPEQRQVVLLDGRLEYDTLIIATGLRNFYFGHDEWEANAPGLKSLEDGLEIRRRVLRAFERAESESDPAKQRACLNFAVVGGGATGVELAGALAELARRTLRDDFHNVDPAEARIFLLEGADRILPAFDPVLSAKAAASLTRLGVEVRTHTLLTNIDGDTITLRQGNETQEITACVVLWAAGMRASPIGEPLVEHTGAKLDKMGRVIVEPDLTVAGHPEVFVIGDLAHCVQDGTPLPGVAPVAMQQGRYVAQVIRSQLAGTSYGPFQYRDKGSLAVIGRNAAIAQMGGLRINGFLAWLLWVFIHIAYLAEFDNKLLVMFQWALNYFTRKRGARLITEDPNPY